MSSKDTNPKDVMASSKAVLSVVPTSLVAYAAMSFYEGMSKYGAFNWRHAGIKMSVYLNALERHLTRFKNGEDFDPETHVPHLASIIACAGIIIDASLHDKCTDDRADNSPESNAAVDKAAQVQAHLRELHKDKAPVHYFKNRFVKTPEPPMPEKPVLPDYISLQLSQPMDEQWFEHERCGIPRALEQAQDAWVVVDAEGIIATLPANMVRWNLVQRWRYYNG